MLRLTEEQYRSLKAQRAASPAEVVEIETRPKRRMNKTETAYAQILEAMKLDGQIRDYGYERHRLRLGDGTWYWPDFDVIDHEGIVNFHEVKGFMREDARVRLQAAAMQYRHFVFWLVRKLPAKHGGGFAKERVWAT